MKTVMFGIPLGTHMDSFEVPEDSTQEEIVAAIKAALPKYLEVRLWDLDEDEIIIYDE